MLFGNTQTGVMKRGSSARLMGGVGEYGEDGELLTRRDTRMGIPAAPAGQAPTLPGPIGGFGGGTFDLDGKMVTPVQRGAPEDSVPAHWTNEGIDADRQAMEAARPARPSGLFGNSQRAKFDYAAALKTLQGEQFKPKWWQVGLATLGDALAMQNGRDPIASQALWSRRDASRNRAQAASEQLLKWQHDDYASQRDADLRAANPRTIGRDLVQFDPTAGRANVLYDGPEDPEIYADSLGFDRGTNEWFAAVEDYVLRSNGPSAHERDLELDDHRTGNDRGLEAYRQNNRVSLEDQRQQGRSAMEGTRQQNRLTLRQTPRAGGREAIPTVASPQEAMRLPSGTKFRTPDGKVKIRP